MTICMEIKFRRCDNETHHKQLRKFVRPDLAFLDFHNTKAICGGEISWMTPAPAALKIQRPPPQKKKSKTFNKFTKMT